MIFDNGNAKLHVIANCFSEGVASFEEEALR